MSMHAFKTSRTIFVLASHIHIGTWAVDTSLHSCNCCIGLPRQLSSISRCSAHWSTLDPCPCSRGPRPTARSHLVCRNKPAYIGSMNKNARFCSRSDLFRVKSLLIPCTTSEGVACLLQAMLSSNQLKNSYLVNISPWLLLSSQPEKRRRIWFSFDPKFVRAWSEHDVTNLVRPFLPRQVSRAMAYPV